MSISERMKMYKPIRPLNYTTPRYISKLEKPSRISDENKAGMYGMGTIISMLCLIFSSMWFGYLRFGCYDTQMMSMSASLGVVFFCASSLFCFGMVGQLEKSKKEDDHSIVALISKHNGLSFVVDDKTIKQIDRTVQKKAKIRNINKSQAFVELLLNHG